MFSGRVFLRLGLGTVAVALLSCAASSENLKAGMTPDQAVQAMGQPDLKDTVLDPSGSGAKVLRYAWVDRGKAATFGPDGHLAEIKGLPSATAAISATSTGPQFQPAFDPVQTPLNYLFYPLRFAFTWIGAGVNCVAEGDCRRPAVRPPDAG